MTEPLVPLIDISKHQGPHVDFAKMKRAGVNALIVRLGNGQAYDPLAEQYVYDARAAGIESIGGYWFCNPKADRQGSTMARRFAARSRKLGTTDLPGMLDVENYLNEPGPFPVLTGSALQEWLVDATDALEEEFGYPPLQYSNDAYYRSQHMTSGGMERCSLIVARYPWYSKGNRLPPTHASEWETFLFEGTSKRPQVPATWQGWSGWQWSAGFNDIAESYGIQWDGRGDPPDLDLNLIKPDAFARWRRQTGAATPAAPAGRPESPIVVTTTPPPAPPPTKELDMAFIIHNTATGEYATVDSGYAVGLDGSSLGSSLPVLEVPAPQWAEYIAVSNTRKAADRALAALAAAPAAAPMQLGSLRVTLTGDASPIAG